MTSPLDDLSAQENSQIINFSLAPLVLIADEDEILRTLLRQLLTGAGYRVVEAGSKVECLNRYEQHQPDLILLDIALAETDGGICCQQFAGHHDRPPLPFLIFTSCSETEIIDRAFSLGATDVITKPFHWGLLQHRIQRLLAAEQATTKLQQQAAALKQLHQQAQQFNFELEQQVAQKTTQLHDRSAQFQQALEFEAIFKRITDKVRDSLDETQILQTAVQEIGVALGATCCYLTLTAPAAEDAATQYEYAADRFTDCKCAAQFTDHPFIQQQIQQAQQPLQFCRLALPPAQEAAVWFGCPIFSQDGSIGTLWLAHPAERQLSEFEMRLVQQIANQCAIGVRLARLYQTSQQQVQQLEALNQVKDDFLGTVSHELRSPLSNMRMAIAMLELHLAPKDPVGAVHSASQQATTPPRSLTYLQILRQECEHELELINDLLDLQRLEADRHTLSMDVLNFQEWVPATISPFLDCCATRQQTLNVNLASDLAPFLFDATCLRRIFRELLNNACKYTPTGGEITVTVASAIQATQAESLLLLKVCNVGSEIPPEALPHIFDKFYRVPSQDLWQQGGTGLGLTLVKKLITRLGGDIQVESSHGTTCFTVALPFTATAL